MSAPFGPTTRLAVPAAAQDDSHIATAVALVTPPTSKWFTGTPTPPPPSTAFAGWGIPV